MVKEKFVTGQSLIHKLDPKIRILSSLVLSISAALCDNLYIATIYLAISIILITMGRLNFIDVMKRLKPLLWFLLMIWIIIPLTFKGETLYQYLWFKVTDAGLLMCYKITIKSITILLIFTALIATMTVASLGNGMHKLNVPDKMVFLVLMSYRYISVIEDEYKRLLRAAKFRGFQPGTNMHSYKTFSYLAGMLFVRASLRAQRVYQAMLCRGFNQKFHTLDVYLPNRLNSIFLMGIFAASAGLVITEFLWT
jgi:cobalt/nickel transport system permease protein